MRRISITEDYYRFSYPSSPDLSPDGQFAVYTVTKAVKETDTYDKKVILKNLSTGEEKRITAAKGQEAVAESEPKFSPDGNSIAFLSDAEGTSQLWLADLESGSMRKLTCLRYGVSDHIWSPDGTRLAFLSPWAEGETEESLQTFLTVEEEERLEEECRKRPVVITDFGYKTEEAMGFAKEKVKHLWLIDLKDDKARLMTDGDREDAMPFFSPDGTTLVFGSSRCYPKEASIAMDLFTVPVTGGEVKRLTDEVWISYYPKPFYPCFTPDGKHIVAGGWKPSKEEEVLSTRIYRVSYPEGRMTSVWQDDAPCHEATCFLYNGEGYGNYGPSCALSEDGKWVYFISGWHGSGHIYRAAIDGNEPIVRITDGNCYYKGISKPRNGCMIVSKGDETHSPELYLLKEDGTETPLTDYNQWIEVTAISTPKELWIDTLDGNGRVQGWLLPPQNREEGKTYPAVLYIHGGPTPFYGYGMTYEHQALAGAGIAVIYCNPRGSGGYGEVHGRTSQAFDGTAYMDLLQFTEAAVSHFPWIDKERLGITGGSYGGYMTNYMITHSSRFKAAVTQRSIANELIQYASSDMQGSSKAFESYLDFMMDAVKKSAAPLADRVKTPLLILHSTGDMRCPVEHAHQFYVAVKDSNPDLPVRLVLIPDSNHSLVTEGIMRLRIFHYDQMIQWFKTYL
jgi:dipeptidyl aminopeptidase/acylaminoacyl peptidase